MRLCRPAERTVRSTFALPDAVQRAGTSIAFAVTGRLMPPRRSSFRAFPGKVDTGFPKANATNIEPKALPGHSRSDTLIYAIGKRSRIGPRIGRSYGAVTGKSPPNVASARRQGSGTRDREMVKNARKCPRRPSRQDRAGHEPGGTRSTRRQVPSGLPAP